MRPAMEWLLPGMMLFVVRRTAPAAGTVQIPLTANMPSLGASRSFGSAFVYADEIGKNAVASIGDDA